MKQHIDKSDEICGLCRYRAGEEELVRAAQVKREIARAFSEKRAYSFVCDSAALSALASGATPATLRETFVALKNKAFDQASESDSTHRSRLANDARLSERLTGAIARIHEAVAASGNAALATRRFVIIKELPGKPSLLHISPQTTVLSHVGQGPFWLEIPTLYLGLKTLDCVDAACRHGEPGLFDSLVTMLIREERAIETGFSHIDDHEPETAAALSALIDAVLEYSSRRIIPESDEVTDGVTTFSRKLRERYLELLDARDKADELNFNYTKNLQAVDDCARFARRFKRLGDRKSLKEVVRLLVAASGHDIHEVRNRAAIALERVFAPKEYDAPVAEAFRNVRIGEELTLEFSLADAEGYFLRVYENTGTGQLPLEAELRYTDYPLREVASGRHVVRLNFDSYGHRDYVLIARSGDAVEWVDADGASGRINVLPDLRGELILEIFVDIHGHTGTYWRDERGHPGLVYNENGEVIRLGRFSDVADHIEYLKDTYSITAIYLLGIFKRGANRQDWAKGATSASPFAPMSLTEIEPTLGGADELKALVKKAHKHGVKIIVDCIPHLNRASLELPDEDIVQCYDAQGALVPRAATDGRYGTWDDGKLLNFRRFEVWQWLAGAVERMIEDFDIDGIRFDSAHAMPVMLKKNNYPLMYDKRRSAEEMVEGRIVVNDREDDHFITTGYFDSQCRDTIAVPFHQYLMFCIEHSVRKKKKNFFVNIAECFWGHERFLSRSGVVPYNSALFKVCEDIMHGKSDVREIYHLYDGYYPTVLSPGTELLGILGNHDERRALNTFGVQGLRAAAGLTSFLSDVIMDFEGNAEGEGWKVHLDNIHVNWNQFESAAQRGVGKFYEEIYAFHRRVRGRGYLAWANSHHVAAAVKPSIDGSELWVGAFNFAETNQTASIQFDNPILPIDDDAFYRVVDPLYSSITGHYNYFSGRELRVSRINTVVSFTQRMKLLRLERVDVASMYDEFLRDSFYRLCSISRPASFPAYFAFNEFLAVLADDASAAAFLRDRLIPLFWKEARGYLELGVKRMLFHAFRVGAVTAQRAYDFLAYLEHNEDRRLAELGRSLRAHNGRGAWVFMSAEADPFSKSGGLANVVFELPRELAASGETVYVITPYYRSGDSKAMAKMKAAVDKYGVKYTGTNVRFSVLDKEYEVGVHESQVDGVTYYLLDHHELFDGLYWGISADEKLRRRVGFARSCAEVICAMDLNPFFSFTNDAFAGVFNGIVRSDQRYSGNTNFAKTSFFHIIHNGGWQYHDAYSRYENGFDLFRLFNLPDWRAGDFLDPTHPERLSCMASGIRFADRAITVSPSYARQIEHHCDGLERILFNVAGISNAVGRDLRKRMQVKFDSMNFIARNWPRFAEHVRNNPELAARIEARYPEILRGPNDVYAIADERRRYVATRLMNKLLLQTERGLEIDPDKMMFVMIHRITEQKGFQLVLNASEGIFKTLGCQAIIGGAVSSGDDKGEEIAHGLWLLGQYYAKNASVSIGFQEVSVPLLSADVFLMPSAHEPGGISQIEAFMCGMLVLARATGGLRDTVFPVRRTAAGVEGNGFLFTDFTPASFYDALERAQKFFTTADEETLYAARMNAERSVYYWDRPAAEYLAMVYDHKEIIRPGRE